eukprot:gene22544-29193_t
MNSISNEGIDESLYSRQLYVFGHEGQKKMSNSNVLIIGLSGLGVETAKNIILAGVKSVTLYDTQLTSYIDLSSQFYLTEDNIGYSRVDNSITKLAELNPYVNVNQLNVPEDLLEKEVISGNYSIVVLIDISLNKQLYLADLCHQHGVYVVTSNVRGLFGSVFCDFGNDFTIYDKNGELTTLSLITNIIMYPESNSIAITVLEETKHNLETGDVVVLSDILGSIGLIINNKQYQVNVKDMFTFEIYIDNDVNIEDFGYERGGYVKQIKQSTTVSFNKMSESIYNPGVFQGDEYKLYRAGLLHLAHIALHQFEENHNYLPEPGNLQEFYDLCISINESLISKQSAFQLTSQDIIDNEVIIKKFAIQSRGNISPVCAFFGGIVGQEVLKACTGKFTPIQQWLYYDFIDSLPDNILSANPVDILDRQPVNSRYDGQIVIYGKSFVEKLNRLEVFIIGAGAIGCEMVKNLAMMGIGDRSSSGRIHLTDPDSIEKSNLSRQFLFRSSNISQSKSLVASQAIKSINNRIDIQSYQQKVGSDTESFFNDIFYKQINVVINALDNIEARLYMDSKCLFYHIPMLESGTLGTKGHTQVVLPYLTEHYGATRDPPDRSIPMCTLKFFPNQIEHTIQWAREWFEEIFRQIPSDTLSYLTNPEYISQLSSQQNMKLETLQSIYNSIVNKPNNINDCIIWARYKFEELFCHQIQQLLYNLPLDKMTPEGTLFWSGAKKPPAFINFSALDPLHSQFVISAAIMRARIYNLSLPDESELNEIYLQIVSHISIPPFKPQDGIKIALTDEEAKNNSNNTSTFGVDVDEQCNSIIRSLPSPSSVSYLSNIQSVEFDKDIDEHMVVVSACANLRARNYAIPEVDIHACRGIAGKIIPAIATTTALVTGGICMELYKIVLDNILGNSNVSVDSIKKLSVDKYYNSFYNLALPLFTSINPEPPKQVTSVVGGKEIKWNQWDRIDINEANMTVGKLIKHIEESYNVDVVMLSAGVTIIFSSILPLKKANERKAMTVKSLVESLCKKTIPDTQKYIILEMLIEDKESGDEVDLPYIRFSLFE